MADSALSRQLMRKKSRQSDGSIGNHRLWPNQENITVVLFGPLLCGRAEAPAYGDLDRNVSFAAAFLMNRSVFASMTATSHDRPVPEHPADRQLSGFLSGRTRHQAEVRRWARGFCQTITINRYPTVSTLLSVLLTATFYVHHLYRDHVTVAVPRQVLQESLGPLSECYGLFEQLGDLLV